MLSSVAAHSHCLGTIVFSGGSWVTPVFAGLFVLAVALIWAARRGAAESRIRLVCALLKALAVAALALCLLNPLSITQHARPGANLFALIADNSQSLQIKDSDAPLSRGESLRQDLTADPRNWQSALEENFQARRYTFDARLQDSRDFKDLNFEGHASALGNALRAALEHWHGQPVAGVLLFTDGNATDMKSGLPSLAGCPPVYPVLIGRATGLHDVGVDKVATSQTAFEDAPVTIQAQVGAIGFAGAEITARLTEVATGTTSTNESDQTGLRVSAASNLVATLTQRAPADGGELNFRFQIQPDKPGIHFYQLEARDAQELKTPAEASREATLLNNQRMLAVDRGQEPFRVLCVSGRPNWEFKFLNRAIQEDPQVQMVSLIRVARREPKFEFKGRAGESSNPLFRGFEKTNEDTVRYDQPVIIRLNTKDEFELRGGFPKTAEELFRYHAVILDHVEAEFFSHEQLLLLRRFVSERGGGFLMLGGSESFHEGGYAGTEIATMLPVYLDRRIEAKWPASLKLTLTREGWLQPWTRLRGTESDEQKRLEAMPHFEIINPVSQIKPGASVLATVSDPDGHSYPALVVQRYGFGNAAALTLADLWRWGLQDETMQEDLAKAWRQLVRWLVSDVPSRVSVQVEAADNPSEVRLLVKARDEEFKPMDNATVKLTVRAVQLLPQSSPGVSPAPAGLSSLLSATNSLELSADPAPNDPGAYEATYIARQAGAYCVDALVNRADGQYVGRAAAGWSLDPAADEFRSLKPNRQLMEALAKRTGGEVVEFDALPEFVRKLPLRHAPITETSSQPAWHTPAVFLLVLGCFTAEWAIRRRKGLP
jgi:uncharacterized membrane protein